MAHILVIDDDMDIRLLITMILESAGHTVTEASYGTEGLALVATSTVDCVLVDINMPGMNGWEVCRRIKANPATAGIPVVMKTVGILPPDESALRTACPDSYVNKPDEKPELLAAIDTAMMRSTRQEK